MRCKYGNVGYISFSRCCVCLDINKCLDFIAKYRKERRSYESIVTKHVLKYPEKYEIRSLLMSNGSKRKPKVKKIMVVDVKNMSILEVLNLKDLSDSVLNKYAGTNIRLFGVDKLYLVILSVKSKPLNLNLKLNITQNRGK